MNKSYTILFFLCLILNYSKSIDEPIEYSPYSQLIGMVRIDVIDKTLQNLPEKNYADILEMLIQMSKSKEKYSLKEVESAYLAYKWIVQNIQWEGFIGNEDIGKVYSSGKGNYNGISSLFNRICKYLGVYSDSISGYLKFPDLGDSPFNEDFTWNYVSINNSYYLIDASLTCVYKSVEINGYYKDFLFGTNPEIFIRYHFPLDNKWQLLSEPYTFQKFNSMAILLPPFNFYGLINISPDTLEINESGKIIITSDESIPDLIIESAFLNEHYRETIVNRYNISEGKVEINFNIIKEDVIYLFLYAIRKNQNSDNAPFVAYKINHSNNKKISLN